MTAFIRTPDENFAGLAGFDFEPDHHEWQDLRMHYLDEGPVDGPVMLLMHGMPTWSYLYRHMIPPLVAAGYRCIAPDHMGFGRSDKPTDIHWYTIARHTEILTTLITALDLNDITLVCQDWGGPTGLAQAATMPERFSRLVIMNTWLHHPEFEYSPAIHRWNQGWQAGGIFDRECPDVALLLVLTAGLARPEEGAASGPSRCTRRSTPSPTPVTSCRTPTANRSSTSCCSASPTKPDLVNSSASVNRCRSDPTPRR